MAVSGVSVNADCVEEFNKLKLKKTYQYVQYKISDDLKRIELDKTTPQGGGSREDNYSQFVEQLPAEDCRYAVYDFHYTMGEAGDRQKLVFVVWIPDTAKVKKKMLYAASKDAIKKALIGIAAEVQATEPAELDIKDIEVKMKEKK